MIPCDREGNFRVTVVDYGLIEENSGAIAISLIVHLDQRWNREQDEPGWENWGEYAMSAEGRIYVVKSDGNINKGQAEALMKYGNWDGNFDSIANKTWEPAPFSCNIEPNTYKGVTTYRVGFVNDYNSTPGQRSNVSPEKASELQSRFGSQFRALAGTVKRNAVPPPPNSRPKPPPPASQQLAPPPSAMGEIPF